MNENLVRISKEYFSLLTKYTRGVILAASAGWVAVLLNIFPGLGAGYIYQRRWKAYWITCAVSVFWLIIGVMLQNGIDPSDPAPSQTDQIGFYGLLAIASITAAEAGISVTRAREASNNE